MYNSQINPVKTSKNTTRFIGYGMVLGTFLGVVIGNFYKYQVPSIIVSILVCMVFAYLLGKKEDKKINEQLEKYAYAVKESTYEKEKNIFRITIIDKKYKEKTIEVKADKYRSMQLKKAELVYLKENGKISPAYSHTKEQKHKSLIDIAQDYKRAKSENESKDSNS